jgi:HSP20 family protein
MPELARWRPFHELEELWQRLDRALDETRGGGGDGWTLAIDLQEQDDKYVLRADVPGMKAEDVQIEVEDDVLTVTGKHEETEEEKKGDFVRRERRYGSFSRSMTLPKGVSSDQIEASCKDGVLEVMIPRPKEAERQKVTISPKAG